jgi:hypothetical protein
MYTTQEAKVKVRDLFRLDRETLEDRLVKMVRQKFKDSRVESLEDEVEQIILDDVGSEHEKKAKQQMMEAIENGWTVQRLFKEALEKIKF